MRNGIATAVMFGLISVLPAAAATCPGNVTYHDTFATQGPGWNTTTGPTVKVTMGGGKADFNFTGAGLGQSLQYTVNQYGDLSLCATVSAPATDRNRACTLLRTCADMAHQLQIFINRIITSGYDADIFVIIVI